MGLRLAVLVVLLPLTARASVEGENAGKRLRAIRTAEPPVIDGSLGDAAWRTAPPDDRFRQRFPDHGAAPTERTEVRVLYDDNAIYVGVRLYDRQPQQIVGRLTRRDRVVESDWVEITFDTRHDHRSSFLFNVNAAGVQLDGQFFDDVNFTTDWDAIWEVQVSVDAGGWTAEYAIPLTALRFSSADVQEWGFQVTRKILRTNEEIVWAFIPNEVQGWTSQFAHLTGLEGLRPRRALELRPYLATRLETQTERGNPILGLGPGRTAEGSNDVGADLKVGLTSGLTLDLTVNPDFGQVEADQVVLNLSRFETFFPEKRPFFLEGREVFETPIQLFYPRRVAGRIWSAAKVTGNVGGGVSLGALSALSEPDDPDDLGTGLRLYNVARSRYVRGNAGAGVMFTGRTRVEDDDPEHDGYAQAVDGFWTSTNGAWKALGQVVLSERVGGLPTVRSNGTRLDGGDVGWGISALAARSAEHTFAELTYHGFSPELEVNDSGFLTEFDTHLVKLITAYGQRTPCRGFQFWHLIPVFIGGMNHDGVLTDVILGADTEVMFKNFIFTSPELFARPPGTWDIHETGDGARFELPALSDGGWELVTDRRKDIVLVLRPFAAAGWTDPRRTFGVHAEIDWNPVSAWQIELDPELSLTTDSLRFFECAPDTAADCTEEAGERRYTFARLDSRYLSLTLRTTYTLSTRLSAQAYAQLFYARGNWHDPVEQTTQGSHPYLHRDDFVPAASPLDDDEFRESTLNVNLVLRWEPIPGTTLFGVYTRAQSSEVLRLDRGPTGEVVLVKLVYYLAP